MCGPSCGNLDSPPSRHNMSLFAIIELVIMGVVGVLCLVHLVGVIQNGNPKNWGVIDYLNVVIDALIVIGLVLILIGLFCSPSQYQIRSGILCFCVGTILSIVVTVLIIMNDKDKDRMFYNICYVILLVFLAWILWRQSYHL
jgi:hypothetical membrane protein